MAVALARIRMPLVWVGVALLISGPLLDLPIWLPLGVFVIALAIYFRIGTVRGPALEVALPVEGRWLAFNSPADRVPSHGLHAYGQTYGIDFVSEPEDGGRPKFGQGPLTRPPTDFPAFGELVFAPATGTVVRVHDRERDHASRTSWPALVYMLTIEAFMREVLGPNRIVGNHVVLLIGDDTYALLAHLKRGSIRVKEGDRLRGGDPIGACGNSGNSSEPHVHLQLMDRPGVLFAAGLPIAFDHYEVDGESRRGVPDKSRPFVAP